jgi:hypothetical protein
LGGLVLAIWAVPGLAAAGELDRATLTVRTYNHFGVSTDDLLAARARVEATFEDAGVHLLWRDCWYRRHAGTDAPHCRLPHSASDLTLRLQAADPAHGSRFVSMGFSLVHLPDRAPFLATVFADLVSSIARGSSVDFAMLLGRAIAHELGHLLLNRNDHAGAGLMRADWTRRDLKQDRAADWRFEPDEIAAIRAAAASRTSR